MPPRATTRTRNKARQDGPTPISIPTCFLKHHSQLAPFARANLPPRMPVPGSVTKLRALASPQLNELCEDIALLLPLWRTGIPTHTLAPGQLVEGGGDYNGAGTGSTPTSGASIWTSTGLGTAEASFSLLSPPALAQVQVQMVPAQSYFSSTLSQPPYSIYTATTPPGPSLQPAPLYLSHSIPGVPPPMHHPGQFPHHQHYQAPTIQPSMVATAAFSSMPSSSSPGLTTTSTQPSHSIGLTNLNYPNMRPPTQADARALAPHLSIWLPNAPKKRNESRVKLARSFMAGFEGMQALVWDVTMELERRWPLGEEF